MDSIRQTTFSCAASRQSRADTIEEAGESSERMSSFYSSVPFFQMRFSTFLLPCTPKTPKSPATDRPQIPAYPPTLSTLLSAAPLSFSGVLHCSSFFSHEKEGRPLRRRSENLILFLPSASSVSSRFFHPHNPSCGSFFGTSLIYGFPSVCSAPNFSHRSPRSPSGPSCS